MKLSLSVRNQAALIANFRAFDQEFQKEAREAVHDVGEFCEQRVKELCPVSEGFTRGAEFVPGGFMRDHAETVYSENGYVFETGWNAQDFLDDGRAFYPVFQIFGTSKMPANDCLTPAYFEARPMLLDRLRAAAVASAARFNQ